MQTAKEQALKRNEKSHSTLVDQFDVLASNHEEMIRIKDSYKEERDKLREEVAKMKQEKESLYISDCVVTPLEELLTERGKEIEQNAGESIHLHELLVTNSIVILIV